MSLFPIPLLIIFFTVSEQQPHPNTDDVGSGGNLLRFNRQRYPEYDEPAGSSVFNPCPDRRSMNQNQGYQGAPVGVPPNTFNQWSTIMPIPTTNEEAKIPAGRLLSQQLTEKPVQETPVQQALVTPGRILMQIPAKNSKPLSEQIDYHIVPTHNSERQVYISQQPEHQPIETEELRTNINPQSEELPEFIIKHNQAIPSHKQQQETTPQETIYQVPVQNRTTRPYLFDLALKKANKPSLNEPLLSQAKPANIQINSHITTSPKPKIEQIESVTAKNCYLLQEEPSEDILPQLRRSMSQGGDLDTSEHYPSKQTDNLHENHKKEVLETHGPAKDVEDDSNRNAYSPQLYPLNPSYGVNYANPKPYTVQKNNFLLLDPTKGVGISPLSNSRPLMMESGRVCFACSSLNEASCWAPNRTTTVKYCRPGHDVCVTKTYKKSKSVATMTVIRDCNSACDVDTPGLDSHYDSCVVCKEDLCNYLYVENSAFSLNPLSSIIIFVVPGFIKYLF